MDDVVKISSGNSKMGSIRSVSLPPKDTCREDAPCFKDCYALKICRLRPSVRHAYAHNLEMLKKNPEIYWNQVETAVKMSRFFRFHVAGDIPDANYFMNMVAIAKRNAHCELLCFTKQYEIVNKSVIQYIAEGGLPKNLHIIFSGWPGLTMVNPFNFPEAHVRFKDGSTEARDDAIECGGNCTECAETDGGCWTLTNGQQVIFDKH